MKVKTNNVVGTDTNVSHTGEMKKMLVERRFGCVESFVRGTSGASYAVRVKSGSDRIVVCLNVRSIRRQREIEEANKDIR